MRSPGSREAKSRAWLSSKAESERPSILGTELQPEAQSKLTTKSAAMFLTAKEFTFAA